MTVRQALAQAREIVIPESPLPVEHSAAEELLATTAHQASRACAGAARTGFRLGVLQTALPGRHLWPGAEKIAAGAPKQRPWVYIRLDSKGEGEILASHANFLYGYTCQLIETWSERAIADFQAGRYYTPAFRWHRPLYDYLLTQVWRTARHVNAEQHIRELARNGYTHLEVNGLAQPVPLEMPVPGEFYSQFYNYCMALDQYVYSELNKGIYPVEYLQANLTLLTRYAALGKKYGLEPGILCFEPRSVPESLLQKYPTLRGARVDHPLRSRRPRYNLSLAHPLVQAHYTEMMQKLLHAVPDLAYMSIWSNDSGAGFEYTSSLYVGRNGGPYLIREWRTHEQIAEVAGKNVVRFMKLLRDAASAINPNFRVALRLEPFKVEHDVILEHLEQQLDIEVPSLLVRGYELPYQHDKYPEIGSIAGSIQHLHLVSEETELVQRLARRGIASHLIYSHGNGFNLEPLVGIPFPWMLWQKLQAMRERGIEYAANLGGFTPSSLAPYHINQHVFRCFMLDPEVELEQVLVDAATQWAGTAAGPQLIALWRQTDETIRWLPPLPLYSGFGFVWLRVWVRPIIPDLLSVPEADRRYYENFMVSPANNTNLTDLGKDVLFDLISREYGETYVERIDANVLPRLEKAIETAAQAGNVPATSGGAVDAFGDLYDRLLALRCWVRTLRSVAAWVAGVYGYLEAIEDKTRRHWRCYLDAMMDQELENARQLLELWRRSPVQFMVVSEAGESAYLYGENFGELVERKIELMQRYRHVEPRIDRDILWRV